MTTRQVDAEKLRKFDDWSEKQDAKKAKKDSDKFADKELKKAHMEEWQAFKDAYKGS